MPIAGMAADKRPPNRLPAKARSYVPVVSDITIVIIFYKLAIKNRPKYHPSYNNQKNAYQRIPILVR
jgi:hypothetical protein